MKKVSKRITEKNCPYNVPGHECKVMLTLAIVMCGKYKYTENPIKLNLKVEMLQAPYTWVYTTHPCTVNWKWGTDQRRCRLEIDGKNREEETCFW